MEMSPNQVRTASFASARKGWDPSEVTAFLERAADALESAQNHATAMEARARAAVSKLQEFSNAAPSTPGETERPPVDDQAETISRTLLLAQRAADEAIAEATTEAERIVAEARLEARRAESEERDLVRSEVESLTARRDFLQSDVEQLENFLLDQRERLRSAASALVQMAEQVPGGLGYIRPPLLSASDDDTPSSTSDWFVERDVLVDDPGEGARPDADDGLPVTGGPDDELRIDPLDVGDDAGERRRLDEAADVGTAVDGTTGEESPGEGTAEDDRADDDRADDDRAAMPTIRIGGGLVPGSVAGDDDPTPEGLPLRFARDVEGGADGDPQGGDPPDRTGGSGR